MAQSPDFFRTARSLERDRSLGAKVCLGAAGALLTAWSGWFFLGNVTVYETSADARIESVQQAHRIEAPVAGQLLSVALEIGREVKEGDVVAELDGSVLRLQLDEAIAQQRESAAAATLAGEESRRYAGLHAGGQVSEMDFLRVKAQATRTAAAAEALKATVARLTLELGRRQVKAPISGRIAEVSASLRKGSVLKGGEHLGTIIPDGNYRIVAFYPPAALGRVQPGQLARMRLTGFPWTEFGMIQGEVSRVSSETRDGQLRVEHAVTLDPRSPLVPQHGMPGSIEVAVERVSPVTLALRAICMRLTPAVFRDLAGK